MRKIFEYIGLITLMCFSFFITEKTSMIAKDIDDIMVTIKSEYQNYEEEGMNAVIKDNTIVPGSCSKKVDIDKSYNEMKKNGYYDIKMYQYQYLYPDISLINNYDKLIISANTNQNKIYLFIELTEHNKKLISEYQFQNYNFIVSYNFYQNNIELIEELLKQNNSILLSNTNFKNYKDINDNYQVLTDKKISCYNIDNNQDFLGTCSSNESMSIKALDTINSQYLLNIKNRLVNGKLLKLYLDDNLLKELPLIDKYIISKGLSLGTIDNDMIEC